MTIGAKLRLALTLVILILFGVIAGMATSKRDLVKPYPREADVQVIFTTPAESEPKVEVVEPTKEDQTEELSPTTKPKPTVETTEASPSATE